MKFDDTIIRDLNRIVNDRGVSHQHRNVASRAMALFITMEEGEESYDPDQTDYKANFESMEERENMTLSILGLDGLVKDKDD